MGNVTCVMGGFCYDLLRYSHEIYMNTCMSLTVHVALYMSHCTCRTVHTYVFIIAGDNVVPKLTRGAWCIADFGMRTEELVVVGFEQV